LKSFHAVRSVLVCIALSALPGLAAAQARAPSEDPSVAAARYNTQLGIEYLKQNNVAAAQEKIERALEQNPKDAGAHTAAGLLYERLREPKKADQHYARALRLDPKNPLMQNNYAVFLCRSGESQKGRKLFEQAATNPLYRTPEVAYANAGVCARSAKDLDSAELNFRKALQLRPTMAEALLQMADLAQERGNGLQARAFLQRYLQAGPVTADALLLGVRIERGLGDARAAGEFETRLRKEFPGSQQAGQIADGRAAGG
jgi:type IV pilus assembly protein PilF